MSDLNYRIVDDLTAATLKILRPLGTITLGDIEKAVETAGSGLEERPSHKEARMAEFRVPDRLVFEEGYVPTYTKQGGVE